MPRKPLVAGAGMVAEGWRVTRCVTPHNSVAGMASVTSWDPLGGIPSACCTPVTPSIHPRARRTDEPTTTKADERLQATGAAGSVDPGATRRAESSGEGAVRGVGGGSPRSGGARCVGLGWRRGWDHRAPGVRRLLPTDEPGVRLGGDGHDGLALPSRAHDGLTRPRLAGRDGEVRHEPGGTPTEEAEACQPSAALSPGEASQPLFFALPGGAT